MPNPWFLPQGPQRASWRTWVMPAAMLLTGLHTTEAVAMPEATALQEWGQA